MGTKKRKPPVSEFPAVFKIRTTKPQKAILDRMPWGIASQICREAIEAWDAANPKGSKKPAKPRAPARVAKAVAAVKGKVAATTEEARRKQRNKTAKARRDAKKNAKAEAGK